jgi:hypothetical protein
MERTILAKPRPFANDPRAEGQFHKKSSCAGMEQQTIDDFFVLQSQGCQFVEAEVKATCT